MIPQDIQAQLNSQQEARRRELNERFQPKLDDFERHMTAIFQRTMPQLVVGITNRDGSNIYRDPDAREMSDVVDRFAMAGAVYGKEAVNLLKKVAAVGDGRERYDPDKIKPGDWEKAKKTTADYIAGVIEQQIKIEERFPGGLTPVQHVLMKMGILKI